MDRPRFWGKNALLSGTMIFVINFKNINRQISRFIGDEVNAPMPISMTAVIIRPLPPSRRTFLI
jgi:hypothetical protein